MAKKLPILAPPLRAVKGQLQKKTVIKVVVDGGDIHVKREINGQADLQEQHPDEEGYVRKKVQDSWEY